MRFEREDYEEARPAAGFDTSAGYSARLYAKDSVARVYISAVEDLAIGRIPMIENTDIIWHDADIEQALKVTSDIWKAGGRDTKRFEAMPPWTVCGWYEIWRTAYEQWNGRNEQ